MFHSLRRGLPSSSNAGCLGARLRDLAVEGPIKMALIRQEEKVCVCVCVAPLSPLPPITSFSLEARSLIRQEEQVCMCVFTPCPPSPDFSAIDPPGSRVCLLCTIILLARGGSALPDCTALMTVLPISLTVPPCWLYCPPPSPYSLSTHTTCTAHPPRRNTVHSHYLPTCAAQQHDGGPAMALGGRTRSCRRAGAGAGPRGGARRQRTTGGSAQGRWGGGWHSCWRGGQCICK